MSGKKVKGSDPLNKEERSVRMSKVRSSGNQSTEMRVAATLVKLGVRGWTKHPLTVIGKPDFLFSSERVVVFVDGCFWHGCARCARPMPVSRHSFWKSKIEGNKRRDRRIRSRLRSQGFHVIRIWEHSLNSNAWVRRLCKTLELAGRNHF